MKLRLGQSYTHEGIRRKPLQDSCQERPDGLGGGVVGTLGRPYDLDRPAIPRMSESELVNVGIAQTFPPGEEAQ